MAENTYKKNTPKKDNKTKDKEFVEENAQSKISLDFVKDRRFHLVLGFFLVMFSLCMLIAFTSYLFTGSDDQSVVQSLFEDSIVVSGQEVHNWLGIFGAVLSYFFVFKWFGIASLLFVPIAVILGVRLLLDRRVGKLKTLVVVSGFFLFWFSLVLGYVALKLNGQNYFSYICGGIGFELATIVDSIAGWGTAFILLFLIITFSIYFFNITSIVPAKKNIEPSVGTIVPASDVAANSENELIDLDDDIFIDPNPLMEVVNAIADETVAVEAEDEADLWVVKKQEERKPKLKGEPEFNIDDAFAALAAQQSQDEMITIANTLGKDVVQDQFVEPSPEDVPLDGEKIANYDPTLDLPHYQYPPVDLLNEFDGNKVQVTKEELEANKDKIVDTLKNYSIGITSIKATIGPTVTLYEIDRKSVV